MSDNQQYPSGAVRERNRGRGRFDLSSPYAERRLAGVSERGADKYTPRNWERGMPLERYIESALRHLAKYRAGLTDEDHLGQAYWNLMAALHTEELVWQGRYPAEFMPSFRGPERPEWACEWPTTPGAAPPQGPPSTPVRSPEVDPNACDMKEGPCACGAWHGTLLKPASREATGAKYETLDPEGEPERLRLCWELDEQVLRPARRDMAHGESNETQDVPVMRVSHPHVYGTVVAEQEAT